MAKLHYLKNESYTCCGLQEKHAYHTMTKAAVTCKNCKSTWYFNVGDTYLKLKPTPIIHLGKNENEVWCGKLKTDIEAYTTDIDEGSCIECYKKGGWMMPGQIVPPKSKIIKLTGPQISKMAAISSEKLAEVETLHLLEKCGICSDPSQDVYHMEDQDAFDLLNLGGNEEDTIPKSRFTLFEFKDGALAFLNVFALLHPNSPISSGYYSIDPSGPGVYCKRSLGMSDEIQVARVMCRFFKSSDLRQLADLLDKHGLGDFHDKC